MRAAKAIHPHGLGHYCYASVEANEAAMQRDFEYVAQIIDREFEELVEGAQQFLNASEWPTPYKNKLQIQSGLKEALAKLKAK